MQSKQKKKLLIKRGDRILTEKPFVYVLHSKYRKERCDHCLTAGKVLKGFAYVHFKMRKDAASAIEVLNGHGYDHLILNVEWSKPQTN